MLWCALLTSHLLLSTVLTCAHQVRALAMFGQQGDGDGPSANALTAREVKMLEALRGQVVSSTK